MFSLLSALCLTATFLGSVSRARPLHVRSPGDPAAIDVRIWSRSNVRTTTGISTTINGQEQFVIKTADDFAFQPSKQPQGSDQDYNLVGVMTFDVVPEEPREMYYMDNTSTGGGDVSDPCACWGEGADPIVHCGIHGGV